MARAEKEKKNELKIVVYNAQTRSIRKLHGVLYAKKLNLYFGLMENCYVMR